MGCHFDELAPPNQTDYFFLVNGSSEHSAIQFLDFKLFKAIYMGEMISGLCRPRASLRLALHGDCVGLACWGRRATKG